MQKSLLSRGSKLSAPNTQIKILEQIQSERFASKLSNLGFSPFRSGILEILQLNLGKMCNQVCAHCHVDAGPDRKEIMTKEVMQDCLKAIKLSNVHTVDLTGGAPEMNPNFLWFVEELSKLHVQTIVRSNLTILTSNNSYKKYPEFFKNHGVKVISSLPCYTAENTDAQRGIGVFDKSITALKVLNELGYGKEGTGLKLDLVYNPGGASLPPDQTSLQNDYKRILKRDYDIEFNQLFTITNLPISRFLDHLIKVNKLDDYMELLIESFNPAAVSNVMCRNTLSVSWDGRLYDCDFNQMLDMQTNTRVPQHIGEFNKVQLEERVIMVYQHCYGCTAGAGSSCQGSLV